LFRTPTLATANVFVSRADYKLVRVVVRSSLASQGLTYSASEYERVGHYHERLKLKLPLSCSLFYGGY
jgi:hypothetical protein